MRNCTLYSLRLHFVIILTDLEHVSTWVQSSVLNLRLYFLSGSSIEATTRTTSSLILAMNGQGSYQYGISLEQIYQISRHQGWTSPARTNPWIDQMHPAAFRACIRCAKFRSSSFANLPLVSLPWAQFQSQHKVCSGESQRRLARIVLCQIKKWSDLGWKLVSYWIYDAIISMYIYIYVDKYLGSHPLETKTVSGRGANILNLTTNGQISNVSHTCSYILRTHYIKLSYRGE